MLKNTLNKALLHVFNNRGKYIVSSGLIITATLLKNNKAIQSLYQNPVLIDEYSQSIDDLFQKANTLLEKNNYHEAEKCYAEVAKFAQLKNDYAKMIQSFCQLAEIYINYARNTQEKLTDRQYSLVKATALYQCAINVENEFLLKQPNKEIQADYTKLIIPKINKIEQEFLALLDKGNNQPYSYVDTNQQHKDKLVSIRKNIELHLNDIHLYDMEKVEELYKSSTKLMQGFIIELWQECIKTIGEPACKYSMVAFGSMARGEMTPYSDFEWGILLENSSEKNKEYFKTLANLLYFKVVNLGETILPAINIKSLQGMDDYITPRGFTFDGQMSRACKTPFGKKKIFVIDKKSEANFERTEDGYLVPGYELLGTPEELAEYQKEKWFEKDRLLPSELCQFTLIDGDEKLANDYKELINYILDEKTPSNKTLRQERALKLLEIDLKTFDLKLEDEERNECGKLYDVKKDLYRLPNTILDGLGLYYRLQSNKIWTKSGWDKINEMVTLGLLSSKGATNIKRALSISVYLRLKTYINNGGQREHLSILEPIVTNNNVFCLVKPNTLLEVYYYTMLPLYEKLIEFCICHGKSFLNKETFFDNSFKNKSSIYLRLLDYKAARDCLKGILKNDPSNLSVLNKLGNINVELNNVPEAINNFKQCLDGLKSIPINEKHYKMKVHTFCNLGIAYGKLGDTNKGKEYLEQALAISEKSYNRPNVIAHILESLGCFYGASGNTAKKKELLERALQIKEESYDKDHLQIAMTLTHLGNVAYELGKFNESKERLERALQIKEKYYGKDHPIIISTLIALGNAYDVLGNIIKKKEFLESALLIQKYYRGNDHQEVAITLNNLANVYGKLGDNIKKKELLKLALSIQEKFYGKNHHENTMVLGNLANVYGKLGDNITKKELLKSVLAIEEGYYGKDHPKVARTLNNLANAIGALGDHTTKKILLERALAIKERHYGPEHVEVAIVLSNLADVDIVTEQERQRSLRAYNIFRKNYGDTHVDTKEAERIFSQCEERLKNKPSSFCVLM